MRNFEFSVPGRENNAICYVLCWEDFDLLPRVNLDLCEICLLQTELFWVLFEYSLSLYKLPGFEARVCFSEYVTAILH